MSAEVEIKASDDTAQPRVHTFHCSLHNSLPSPPTASHGLAADRIGAITENEVVVATGKVLSWVQVNK